MSVFRKIKPGTQLVMIITAADSSQSDQIIKNLEKAGIAALRQRFTDAGMPGRRSKSSAFGENIYVPQADAEKARAVISKMGLAQ